MEPSQQALGAGNRPSFGVPAPATIGPMPPDPVCWPCSNYWYHYWGMIYASQKECHGLLPPVSSLLQASGHSVEGDVGCADASGSSTGTQWQQERGNENVVGNTPSGDSAYAGRPSAAPSTGHVSHNFPADSVPSESCSSGSVPSSRVSSGDFFSGDIPMQPGPGIESQHHMPRSDQPARSDFSDFSNAPTLLPDTNTENQAHALAAGVRDLGNFCASLDMSLMNLTPEDYSNLHDLSLPIPSIAYGRQPESAQQPSTGDNTQNAAAIPEPNGMKWDALSQPGFSLSSGSMDPTAKVNLASAFHLLEVGAATSEKELGSLPARSPAKPSLVIPSSASEGSGDEETPSLLSPFLTQQTVGPRMSPRTAVKHSGPLPSPAASLDSVFNAPSTPVCPHAAAPTDLLPDSERAEPEHDLAQQEAALLSHMVNEERRRWNMLKAEDRFLVVLRSSGVRWSRTQALWSALHSASKSVGALKMQWRRLQDRSPWLSRLISATGACTPVVGQGAKRSAKQAPSTTL